MSTHNILFEDEVRRTCLNCPKYMDIQSNENNFLGTERDFKLTIGKQAIGVSAIKISLGIDKICIH